MTTDLANKDNAALLERVLVGGDLSKLSAAERLHYYRTVCESVGLNPFTRPFDYLSLSGRLVLYAKRDATDQLRSLPQHLVSVYKLETARFDDLFVVTAYARNKDGREDSSTGAVSIANLKGDLLANAIMKAETKAKRRVTLSICGLGLLDETEVATVAGATPNQVDLDTGELLEAAPPPPAPAAPPAPDRDVLLGRIEAGMDKLAMPAIARVELAERVCGMADWTQAETGDLELLLAELLRRHKASKK